MAYVTVATADDIFHAHFLGQALEEEGIQYIEANENIATMLPHLRQGIQIRVKDIDYLRAKVVCERVEEMRRLHCPECDSTEMKYLGLEARPLTFTEKVMKLLRFPVSGQMLVYGCRKCHATLKTR